MIYDPKIGGLSITDRNKLRGRWYSFHEKGSIQRQLPGFAVDYCPNMPKGKINHKQQALDFKTHMADTSSFYKKKGLTLFPQDLMDPLTFRKVFFDYEGDQSEFATVPKTW